MEENPTTETRAAAGKAMPETAKEPRLPEKVSQLRQKLGTPQGGVASPLPANLYLHWFDALFHGPQGPARWAELSGVHVSVRSRSERTRGADPSLGSCACLRREFSGEPDAGNPHLRFDEGRGAAVLNCRLLSYSTGSARACEHPSPLPSRERERAVWRPTSISASAQSPGSPAAARAMGTVCRGGSPVGRGRAGSPSRCAHRC